LADIYRQLNENMDSKTMTKFNSEY